MMKKLLLVVLLLTMVSGCAQNEPTDRIPTVSEDAGIHEISYESLKSKLSSDDNFVLYIGRPDCGDCVEFSPILDEYLKEHDGVVVYYLNVKAFRDAANKEGASQEEIDFFENIKKELSYNWTPTLQHYKKGELLDSYTYLDTEFYSISDKEEQEKKKEDFINEFKNWMSETFE